MAPKACHHTCDGVHPRRACRTAAPPHSCLVFGVIGGVSPWRSGMGRSPLSNTIDTSFCGAALEEAPARSAKPEIFTIDHDARLRLRKKLAHRLAADACASPRLCVRSPEHESAPGGSARAAGS